MSKFYARITRSARRTQPSARGHGGVTVWAQSWAGPIKTSMWLCSETGKECYSVALHEGSAGAFKRLIAEGYCDGTPFQPT